MHSGLQLIIASDVRLNREALVNFLTSIHFNVAADNTSRSDGRSRNELVILIDCSCLKSGVLLKHYRARYSSAGLIVFGLKHDEQLGKIVNAEVDGLLSAESGPEELQKMIEDVARGGRYCSPALADALLRHFSHYATSEIEGTELTSKEKTVLGLLELGLTNKQIAVRMAISVPTVKTHVHHILNKLRASRRGEAVAVARRLPADDVIAYE